MNKWPLRYQIATWNKLPECMSNNSNDLRITVANVCDNPTLSGLLIQVMHTFYGCLFACIVHGEGSLLSEVDSDMNQIAELSTQDILDQLARFGFDITYQPEINLDGLQIQFLMTLDNLRFDKIRQLRVYKYLNGAKVYEDYVVAFNVTQHPNWLDNTYVAIVTEFMEGISNGSAINVTKLPQAANFKWDWLDYVANIKDIIEMNACVTDDEEATI